MTQLFPLFDSEDPEPGAFTQRASGMGKLSSRLTPSPPWLLARRLLEPLLHGPRRMLVAAAGTRVATLAAATAADSSVT